jgi:hypothetical protein
MATDTYSHFHPLLHLRPAPSDLASPVMSLSIQELRSTTDEQIIEHHDAIRDNVFVGVQYHLDELARRDAQHSADRIECLTDTVRRLTWIITALTAASVTISVVALRDHRQRLIRTAIFEAAGLLPRSQAVSLRSTN